MFCIAKEPLAAGDEVSVAYVGDCPNIYLMCNYGFVLPQNPYDLVLAWPEQYNVLPRISWDVLIPALATVITNQQQQQQQEQQQGGSSQSGGGSGVKTSDMDQNAGTGGWDTSHRSSSGSSENGSSSGDHSNHSSSSLSSSSVPILSLPMEVAGRYIAAAASLPVLMLPTTLTQRYQLDADPWISFHSSQLLTTLLPPNQQQHRVESQQQQQQQEDEWVLQGVEDALTSFNMDHLLIVERIIQDLLAYQQSGQQQQEHHQQQLKEMHIDDKGVVKEEQQHQQQQPQRPQEQQQQQEQQLTALALAAEARLMLLQCPTTAQQDQQLLQLLSDDEALQQQYNTNRAAAAVVAAGSSATGGSTGPSGFDDHVSSSGSGTKGGVEDLGLHDVAAKLQRTILQRLMLLSALQQRLVVKPRSMAHAAACKLLGALEGHSGGVVAEATGSSSSSSQGGVGVREGGVKSATAGHVSFAAADDELQQRIREEVMVLSLQRDAALDDLEKEQLHRHKGGEQVLAEAIVAVPVGLLLSGQGEVSKARLIAAVSARSEQKLVLEAGVQLCNAVAERLAGACVATPMR